MRMKKQSAGNKAIGMILLFAGIIKLVILLVGLQNAGMYISAGMPESVYRTDELLALIKSALCLGAGLTLLIPSAQDSSVPDTFLVFYICSSVIYLAESIFIFQININTVINMADGSIDNSVAHASGMITLITGLIFPAIALIYEIYRRRDTMPKETAEG